jgi:hypothetical protein
LKLRDDAAENNGETSLGCCCERSGFWAYLPPSAAARKGGIMSGMRNLWVSGVVLAAMSPVTLTAEVLTEDELDMVTAGQVQITPRLSATSITGNLSSTRGLTANFSTSGYVSITGLGEGDITSLPASITGTLSSIEGLTARLATESGSVVLVTAADARRYERARETPGGQSQRINPAGTDGDVTRHAADHRRKIQHHTRHHKAEGWRSSWARASSTDIRAARS